MKKITLFLVLLIATITVKAQAPFLINYQAIARNAAGVEIGNRTMNVKFILHKASPTGLMMVTDLHNGITTNNFGLFTTTIGSGIISGPNTIGNIRWDSAGAIFLEVDIDTN